MVAALVLLDDHSALGTLDENAKRKYSIQVIKVMTFSSKFKKGKRRTDWQAKNVLRTLLQLARIHVATSSSV